MDTIQIVQSLRSYLPPPHIPVSSWKSESGAPSSINNASQVGGMVVAGGPTTPKASEVSNA